MQRRDVLRWLAVASTTGASGCIGSLTSRADEKSNPGSKEDPDGKPSCDEYVYQPDGSGEDGELPWHLYIRNISLSTYSVSISITDLSGETPDEVVSCTATSETHRELVFDLSSDTQYRVQVTLNRPDNPEEASTTVSGWNRVTGTNEALRVEVENGKFGIRRVHYDPGKTPTGES